jgi:hypothetical protein
LLRFARKTPKNRLKGDFLPCKLPGEPTVRKQSHKSWFLRFFQRKSRKNLQVQQAPGCIPQPHTGETERRFHYRRYRRGLPFFLCAVFGFFFLRFPAAAQTSLETELRNLEGVAASGGAGRREALGRTACLKELAGDIEGAARAWEMAARAEPGGRDHRSMLRGAACFIALGDWERADAALKEVLAGGPDQETRVRARFLAAQLEALRGGGADSSGLVSLLAEGDFGAYKSRIYFTLWKLTGREDWLRSLIGECPHSPEAAAAGSGETVSAAATAMWLLFPGRQAPVTAPGTTTAGAGTVLQTGLFGREENARALLEKLRGAGFPAGAARHERPGGVYTLVYVVPGPDINASIRQLKAAGFESFPVSLPPG